jgi:hypothetical protein
MSHYEMIGFNVEIMIIINLTTSAQLYDMIHTVKFKVCKIISCLVRSMRSCGYGRSTCVMWDGCGVTVWGKGITRH